jgi:uncharacterized protein (DUF2267 family)
MRAYLTYGDLAELFDLSVSVLRRRMRGWEAEDFPAPLPYSLRQKRWDAASVRRWKARLEFRAGSVDAPPLHSVA